MNLTNLTNFINYSYHDAYPLGAKVSHNEKHWTSTVENNVWEPGVYGWEEVTDEA